MGAERAETVIIGGGVAGASLAWRLAERGARGVVLLEREETHDHHATGRSAATFHVLIPEPATLLLTRASAPFFSHPPPGFSEAPLIRKVGTLVVGRGAPLVRQRILARIAGERGVRFRLLTAEEVVAKVPAIDPEGIEGGIFFPDDGALDIHALVQGYVTAARRAGARVLTRTEATKIAVEEGRVRAVETTGGTFETGRAVVASGAWANRVGGAAGARPLPMTPCRRHLVVGVPDAEVDPDWPLVVDVSRAVYFRPESAAGGVRAVLFCPMDQDPMEPCDAKTDETRVAEAVEKLSALAPSLRPRRLAASWAGLRTLTPDGAFLLGRDPGVQGLHWHAGVGGYGIQTSPAASALAADLLLTKRCDWFDARLVSPARFASAYYPYDHRLRAAAALLGLGG